MLFNSIQFLIFFITTFLIISLIKKKEYQYSFLIIASYYFYYSSSKGYLLLFVISSLVNFFLGNAIFKTKEISNGEENIQSKAENISSSLITSTHLTKRKFFLCLGLVFNLGLLGIFKYLDFSILIINDLSSLFGGHVNFSLLHIILPIGISFYTFEALSYILDIYWEKIVPEKSLTHFLLFLAFFPKLIAGPIVRASELLPQFAEDKIKLIGKNLKEGLTTVIWGIGKKILIADNISIIVNSIFSNPEQFSSSLPIIFGAFAFGIQIYCDFSGYSDIAIGLAKMFGFTIPQNFQKPYLSKNPAEFWRRWHITLSFWIRDYLYTPLYVFFSRRKLFQKIQNLTLRTKINIYLSNFIALFFIGIWHGAYWNFVFFGIYNGFLVVGYYVLLDARKALGIFGKYGKNKIVELSSISLTFYLTMFGFLLFRITNLSHLFFSLKRYSFIHLSGFTQDISLMEKIIANGKAGILMFFVFVVFYLYYAFIKQIDMKEKIQELPLYFWTGVLILFFIIFFIFLPSKTGVFIYFQF